MGTTTAGNVAAIKTAKAAAEFAYKEATRKVGQQVGKELAKGVIPSAFEEVWYEGTKMTLNEFLLLDTSLSGISSGGINEGVKRKPVEIAFELTKEAAKKAAKEEFM